MLDLGDVRDIANVWANGVSLGCLWEPPYRVEIPRDLLGSGHLDLRVEVVTTWPNGMIGDASARQRGADEPKVGGKWPQWVIDNRPDSGTGIFTWSSWGEAFRPDEPLVKSGLLGPVVLRSCPAFGKRARKE